MFNTPRSLKTFLVSVPLSFVLCNGVALADGDWSIVNQQANNPDLFTFDYGVPESPALTLAGLGDASLSPSTSLKPFVLSLPGLLSSDSSQSSAALDMAPAWIFSQGRSVSPDDYEKSYGTQLLFRTRLGLALFKGDTGATDPTQQKASRVAIGLSTSLLPDSDPVLARNVGDTKSAWMTCLDDHIDDLLPVRPFEGDSDAGHIHTDSLNISKILPKLKKNPDYVLTDREQKELDAAESDIWRILKKSPADLPKRLALKSFDRVAADRADVKGYILPTTSAFTDAESRASTTLEGCRKQASDAAQHSAALDIGAGAVWSGTPGQWANFANPNDAMWIAGRYPLDFGKRSETDCGDNDNRGIGERLFSCWMVGGSGRYSVDEMVATGDTTTPQFKANVVEGWLGLERIDSKTKFGAYYGYLNQSAVEVADKSFSNSGDRWLFSAAYSLDFLYQGLWLQGSYGVANGSVSTLNDKVALLTLTLSPPSLGSGFVTKNSSSGDSSTGGSQSTTSTTTSSGL